MTEMLATWVGWLVGPVLVYAAAAKTAGFVQFRAQVADLVRADALARVAALGVVAAEYTIGGAVVLGVVAGYRAGEALLAAAGLLSVFTLFIGWVVWTGRSVRCHCFGEEDGEVSSATLVRNLVLVGAAAAGGVLALTAAGPLGWSGVQSAVTALYGLSSGLLLLAGYRMATLWSAARNFV